MPRILFALVLLTCLISNSFAQTPSTINRVRESVMQTKWMDGENGMLCTAFSVGITWAITAKHCLPPEGSNLDITIEDKPVKVIKSNDAFALLEVPAGKYPILWIRKDRPKVGEEVTSFGFPYGFPLMSFKRYVAAFCQCNFAAEDHLIMDGKIGKGMSGGPVVDINGKVVGLNQAGVDAISIACTAEEIRDFLK